MINADTAIVGNGVFIHYCHDTKGFMVLRVRHQACPFCLQKNPDYIPNQIIYTVSNLVNGSVIMAFSDENSAIAYLQKHPLELWGLGDTGFVDSGTKS